MKITNNDNKREVIDVNGSILIWSKVKKEEKQLICNKYGLFDIIGLEQVINDLIQEKNEDYLEFVEEKRTWCNHLFTELIRK